MSDKLCEAEGFHKHFSFIRDIFCSLKPGHEGRHIAYWNNVVTDEWIEGEQGEIGGPFGGTYFDWKER